MLYKNIRHTSFKNIQRIASIYDFPYDEDLMDAFAAVNGGEPVDFKFKCINESGYEFDGIVKRLLSFDPDDNENIEEAMDIIGDLGGTVVPFALDDEDNYICYVNNDDEATIKLFDINTCEYYNIYSEHGDDYDVDSFLDDLLS